MRPPTIRVITDGTVPGTKVILGGDVADLVDSDGRLKHVEAVETVRDGNYIDVTLRLRLESLEGDEHPFSRSVHSRYVR